MALGRTGATICGALLLVCLPDGLSAQSIEVRLLEESTGRPVSGALVRLLGPRGPVAQGLSSEAGRVVLRASSAGDYRVKVDRIGWTGLLAGPYTLEAGREIRRELRLPSERLLLPSLEVAGSSRCAPVAQGGPLAAALWEEIRKALAASIITGNQWKLPLHVRVFQRDVDFGGRAVRERLEQSEVVQNHRYVALPAADLATRGFIFETDTITLYAAPDAELLLSDEFVDTHCFRAVQGAGSRVGLAFQPLRSVTRPDVEGTLWVDRTTSELEVLEYKYTGVSDTALGGRVVFQRLPTGGWIVNDWHIRGPRQGGTQHKKIGYRDRGARVSVAGDSQGTVTRSLIFGRVWDSLAGRPIDDVSVYVEGLADTIITDPEGWYGMVVEDSGARVLNARHWRLELLGSPAIARTLRWNDTVEVNFGVPSLATLGQALCKPDQTAGVIGVVQRPEGVAAQVLGIHAWWEASDDEHRFETRTRPNGLFAVCWQRHPVGPVEIRFRDGYRQLKRIMVQPTKAYEWMEVVIP